MYSLCKKYSSVAVLAITGILSMGYALAQAPPTPDPVHPNVFYGSIPPDGDAAAVWVFVHGLNANANYWFDNGNTMYADTYNAGYRTAFVSLNVDNTPNSENITKNAKMLQTLVPAIAAHYNVSKVYFVGHSKGGLDIQASMVGANNLMSYAKAVLTIATPNHGTPLADWAFGPGLLIAQRLGLLSPGLLDMRTSYIANLRTQFDPLFTKAGIPFYTMAGTQFTGNPALVITGVVLKSLAPNDANDGLVPVPSTFLPTAYSMQVAEIGANHFQMGTGASSFTFLKGRVDGLEAMLSGWTKIATGGFGDSSNTWNWSQAWFKGKLYVGTGREISCVSLASSDALQGTHLYPPPKSGCPPDPKNLSMAAEIWQYTPETKTWLRVFKSPQDIPIGNDASGQPAFAARDIGIRGMTVYTESDGTQALYAGGVSAGAMFSVLPEYPDNSFPPPRILRTTNGSTWAPIPNDPGTFMGDIVKNNTDVKVHGFRSLIPYKGMLFSTVTNLRGQGFIIASADPKAGNNAWQRVSPDQNVLPVWVMREFNGFLYVGTGDRGDDTGWGLYKTDASGSPPYIYTPLITNGGYQTDPLVRSPIALTMEVFNGNLYVGTDRKTELIRVYPNDTWDVVVGQPRSSTPQGPKAPLSGIGYYFDNDFNGHFWQMRGSNKGLHLGTWDSSIQFGISPQLNQFFSAENGFDFFRSPDGVTWSVISKGGMGDGYNFGGRSSEYTHFGLFWGTARPSGGAQVWLDNSVLDLNNDGLIDQNDVNVITAALGTPAVGAFDPRDVDGDGRITILDARKLTTQCTFPNCSSLPPAVLANVVVKAASFPGTLVAGNRAVTGSTVQLTWPAVPGAVKYRVYRYTNADIVSFFPPGGIPITIPGKGTFTIPQDILNGNLDFVCADPESALCLLINLVKTADTNKAVVGFPKPLQQIATVTTTSYTEPQPTPLQSLYFVRAQDAQGNLTEPSNVVGAPSLAQP